MGGHLYTLPRMPRAAYPEVEAEVRAALDALLPGAYRIPRAYGDKPDFGDLDVLVADPAEGRPDTARAELRARIAAALGITRHQVVGHVFSTVHRDLQTDFFSLPAADLESAWTFMCFNDLGNFVGRICRRFDLKYGERGLTYVYRRGTGNHVAELSVSRDFERICAFLGLDHAAWVRGFETLPDMFAWVVASPYFSTAPYLDTDDDGTPAMQRRGRTRTTVARFVEYLRAEGIERRPTFDDRSTYLPQVMAAFPEARLDAQVEGERAAEARQAEVDARFGGKRVMALVPGLEGKALGEVIRAVRAEHADFESWVLETPQAEIDARVRDVARRLGEGV
jgi:hypothetical protein